MLRTATALIVLCGSLLLGGGAMATPSVVDQYTEQVPTGGGDKPANEVPPATTGGSGDGQPAGGAAGTGPADSGSSGGAATNGSRETAGTEPADGATVASGSSRGGSNSASVADGLESSADDDGMGIVFPLILAAALILTVTILVLRRRRSFDSQAS